ncbi:MAG: hypothetical protein KKD94_01795 [Nanoarchaeota archaeon]|nr:hypothetical protein [Nanoarchaeota archaeon]
MKTFDVGIGWGNSVDKRFVEELKSNLKNKNLSFKEITFVNIREDFDSIDKGLLRFRLFINRSADDYSAFLLLAERLKSRGTKIINDPQNTIHYSSKSFLYKLYKKEKLPLPKVFILNPRKKSKKIIDKIPRIFGVPFVLKPSYGGAGEGIVLSAKNSKDILNFLKQNNTDECLAQEYIIPSVIDGRVAWFRPIFVCGKVIPMWWNYGNRFYQEFGNSKKENQIAKILEKYMKKIYRIVGFDLFSAEFAINDKGKYFIIDYANEPIDLNTNEVAPDGLPPATLEKIVSQIVKSIK